MKLKKKPKLFYFSTIDLIKLRRTDVFMYIKKLKRNLRKKDEIIKLLKIKLKNLCITDKIGEENGSNELDTKEVSIKAKDFVEDIKNAAESMQNMTGFVYEPTSGMYYDFHTGYYYNAELGLYYDGQRGCYYTFNQETNEFLFHSQVCNPQEIDEEKIAQETNKDKKKQNDERIKRNDNKRKTIKKKSNYRHNSRKRRYYSTSSSYSSTTSDDSDHYYRRRHKKKKKKSKKSSRRRRRSSSRRKIESDRSKDKEDGEISSSDFNNNNSDDSIILIEDEDNKTVDEFVYQDLAKKYPPSLRLIVVETNLLKLKVGTLFIVTFKGGSLGREGDHEVLIPDINISKYHLTFSYNGEKSIYEIVDMGSRNGSYVNGKRISNAKQESSPYNIDHGCVLQISQTKLLCHIHDGYATCEQCEPGLVAEENARETTPLASDPKSSTTTKSESHKLELKKIKKKYGLENEKYLEPKTNKNVNDRAEKRRKEVGSQNAHEKTDTASINTAIRSDNKGFKMLSKLGWSAGQSLGKNDSGILEPVVMPSNEGTTGLGCDAPVTVKLSRKQEQRNILWKKTQERFKKLDTCDIFQQSEDEN